MFEHWFSGKSSKYGKEGEPLWVNWKWVMSYARARVAYSMFTAPTSTEHPYIANANALHKLGKILERNDYLTTESRDFDFISTSYLSPACQSIW